MTAAPRTAVAIIGAGPYALSLAAHLAARQVDHRIFGSAMRFWETIARAGDQRALKSFCFGTNLSSPADGLSFADYNRARGLETFEPCSMPNFFDYGRWFQASAVPWLEDLQVQRVRRVDDGYELELSDGSRCRAARVVVATGLALCEHVPDELAALGPDRLVHTSAITRFADFQGRDVAVVGAGQSALEAAALLHEAGARPRLFVREAVVEWNTQVPRRRSLWRRLRSPLSALGSGPRAWLLSNFPGAIRHAPDGWRTAFVQRHLPPAGAWWLRPRVEGVVPIERGTVVQSAVRTPTGVSLRVRHADGAGEREWLADHVVAGTGFVLSVDRLTFLDAELRESVRRLQAAPALDGRFQSSVPGLYFIGPLSALTFGPLFRFVAGVDHTVQVLSRHLAQAARP
jgi:hypothetical protein